MPEVAVRIGPKTYSIACGAGEEDRIRELAALVAEKYARLGTARAPLEAQNMLFASLFMADELFEGRGRIAEAEAAREAALAEAQAAHGALENGRAQIEERLMEEYAASMQALEAERSEAIEALRNDHAAALEAQADELRAVRAELARLSNAAHQHDTGMAEPQPDQPTLVEREREQARWEALNSDLRAENEALRRAEQRARADAERLAGELETLRAAHAQSEDLFSAAAARASANGSTGDETIADTLEALALRAEEVAIALEKSLEPPA
jgi:cell division protein ZapA